MDVFVTVPSIGELLQLDTEGLVGLVQFKKPDRPLGGRLPEEWGTASHGNGQVGHQEGLSSVGNAIHLHTAPHAEQILHQPFLWWAWEGQIFMPGVMFGGLDFHA